MPDPDARHRLEIGVVGRAHGVQGEVLVKLVTDRTERLSVGSVLHTATGRALTVTASRPHQRGHLVRFAEVQGRNDAEALAGEVLEGDPIDDPDTLWIHDLVGSAIEESDGTPRGVVVAVQQNPASDLLVTDADVLVPLTFLVDRRDGVLVIDPPAGLFDL